MINLADLPKTLEDIAAIAITLPDSGEAARAMAGMTPSGLFIGQAPQGQPAAQLVGTGTEGQAGRGRAKASADPPASLSEIQEERRRKNEQRMIKMQNAQKAAQDRVAAAIAAAQGRQANAGLGGMGGMGAGIGGVVGPPGSVSPERIVYVRRGMEGNVAFPFPCPFDLFLHTVCFS